MGIDGDLADAQLAMATVKFFYEWDFAGAEQAFRRAATLNPNHDHLPRRYSSYLLAMKRFDEALAKIKKARQQDPYHSVLLVIEADILRYARRYDQAMAKYREALELNPNNFFVHAQLAEAYEQQGKYEEAMAEHEKAMALSGDTPQLISEFRQVFQQSGIRGFWKKKIDLLTKAAAGRPNAYEIAVAYINLGEKEQAFAWLERMYQERQPVLIFCSSRLIIPASTRRIERELLICPRRRLARVMISSSKGAPNKRTMSLTTLSGEAPGLEEPIQHHSFHISVSTIRG